MRANSGTVSSTLTDTDAISFLQSAQFIHIKTEQPNGHHICASSPQNEIFFLFEHDTASETKNGFRLVRIMNNSRTIIDEGYTMFVEKQPDDKGELSVLAIGDSMKDWEMTCRIASPEKLVANQALLEQTTGVLRKKHSTRRSAEKFVLEGPLLKKKANGEVIGTPQRVVPEPPSFMVASKPAPPPVVAPTPVPKVVAPPQPTPPAPPAEIATPAGPVVVPKAKKISSHKPTSRRFIIPIMK